MTKYKVVLNRPECIGAAACVAVAPKFWKLMEDGKVNLLGGKFNGSNMELIVETEEDLALMVESAQVCPVSVIHVYNEETGEKIA